MRVVKSDSSEWVNKESVTRGKFQWQEGYGAFSHSRSQVDRVVNYIANQQEHHRKKTFKEEYYALLEKFAIPFEERYLFHWIE